jgi:hypothetical protein
MRTRVKPVRPGRLQSNCNMRNRGPDFGHAGWTALAVDLRFGIISVSLWAVRRQCQYGQHLVQPIIC